MKIVITGHNSLLGSNLAKYFSGNNQVILLGTRNKKYKKYQFNYEYNHLDLNNLNVFFNNEKNIDLFIHCASINSKFCYKNSKKAFKFNVKLTEELFKICLKNNIGCFVYLSSVNVYKKNIKGKIDENSPLQNENLYAIYKKAAEERITNIAKNSSMRYLILRLSNVLAEPLIKETNCWDLVTFNLCKEIIEDGTITIKGDSSVRRDFFDIIYLFDFINLFAYNKKFESGIFNLCSGNTLSILDLSKILQSITLEKFSFKPIIKELTQTNNLCSEYFNYSNEKVKKYGFEIKNDIKDMLINILNVTNKFYSSKE